MARQRSGPRVLVVEDVANVAQVVRRGLSLQGYDVEVATTGRDAVAACRDRAPDVIVLDLMLPDLDGMEVCRRIRSADRCWERQPTPVLMLTGRDRLKDRVAGLDAGADDYLVKPFALEELVARVQALVRRSRGGSRQPSRFEYEKLVVDTSARRAERDERPLQLTAREFDLLALFIMYPNQVLSHDVILRRVWGDDFFGESNVLAVMVTSLRRSMEAGGEPRLLQTVRGIGYVLRREPEAPGR
jgi:two-component system response regulator MprA